jgi:hypothetical protein
MPGATQAKSELDDLDGREVRPVISAEDDDFRARADDASAKLDDLDGKRG